MGTFRFRHCFEKEPSALLVNSNEEKEFEGLGLKVNLDNKSIRDILE